MESESCRRGHVCDCAYDPVTSVLKQTIPRDTTLKQVFLSFSPCPGVMISYRPMNLKRVSCISACAAAVLSYLQFCMLFPALQKQALSYDVTEFSVIGYLKTSLEQEQNISQWITDFLQCRTVGRKERSSSVGKVALHCTRLYCRAPCD